MKEDAKRSTKESDDEREAHRERAFVSFISPYRNRAALLAIDADRKALCVSTATRNDLEALIARLDQHLEIAR